MQYCYGAKASSLDSGRPMCGLMFIIPACGENSLDIEMGKSPIEMCINRREVLCRQRVKRTETNGEFGQ